MEEIHKKIKALRKRSGATLEKMGEAIGMSKGNLSRLERGEISISMEWLEKIAHFFGISVEEFANEHVDRKNPAVKALLENENQILKMQVNTEEFIRSMLNYYLKGFDSSGLTPERAMQKALERFFDLPGTGYLLNGINTRPHYPFIELYEQHKAKRSQEQTASLMRQLFNPQT